MGKKNLQTFNLPKELSEEITKFCELNNIEDSSMFALGCLKGGFAIEKFGRTPVKAGKKIIEKEVEKEVIKEVEKIVEVENTEKIDELTLKLENLQKELDKKPKKIIEKVYVEVPVEKIVEKEVYVTDDLEIKELSTNITNLEKKLVDTQNHNITLQSKADNLEKLLSEKPKEIIKKVEDKEQVNSLQNEIKTLKNKIEEYEDVLNHFRRFSGSKATHLKSSRLNDNLYKD